MKNIMLLTWRELGSYLRSPMGYVIIALVLFVDGLFFNSRFVAGGAAKFSSEVLRDFYVYATFMTLVGGVLLSMRLIAEERQMGTLVLLLSSPIKEWQIVLGKFLSSFIFLCLMTSLSLYMPALIFVNGKVSIGHIVAGYCGLFLAGGLSLAMGMFASSLARTQVVAVVSGAAMMTFVYFCFFGASVAEPPMRDIIAYLSLAKHLQWHNGVINTRAVFYYASSIALFLFLTTQVMQTRRWR